MAATCSSSECVQSVQSVILSDDMSQRASARTGPTLSKEEINRIIDENTNEKWREKQRRNEEARQVQIRKQLQTIESLSEADIKAYKDEMDKLIAETENARDFDRIKVHLDMDAFYASVEVRDNPKLRSQPVAVGGLSMLSTANYVARRYGVKSALAGYIAKKLCPQLVIVPCNFRKYIKVSNVVMSVLSEYDPNLRTPSLDEAYMDLTKYMEERSEPVVRERIRYMGRCICRLPLVTPNDMPGERLVKYDESCLKCLKVRTVVRDYVTFGADIQEVVREMRFRVQQATGLTCSAGIASNSRLAKICSEMRKPNGQFYLEPTRDAVISFMKELPTRMVPGIGPVSEEMLKALGIEKCGELIEKRGILRSIVYEPTAHWYMEVALGVKIRSFDDSKKTEVSRKSIGQEQTFSPCSRLEDLEAMLQSICEELADSLPRHGIVGGKTVVLKLKYDTFDLLTRSTTVGDIVSEKERMLNIVKKSLKELVKNGEKVRLLGVSLKNLKFSEEGKHNPKQKTLSHFIQQSPEKASTSAQHVKDGDSSSDVLPELPDFQESAVVRNSNGKPKTEASSNADDAADDDNDSDIVAVSDSELDIVDVTPSSLARKKLEFVKEKGRKSKCRQATLSFFMSQSPSTSKQDAPPKQNAGAVATCPVCSKEFPYDTEQDRKQVDDHINDCLNQKTIDEYKFGTPLKRKTPSTPASASNSAKRGKPAKKLNIGSQDSKSISDFFGTPKSNN